MIEGPASVVCQRGGRIGTAERPPDVGGHQQAGGHVDYRANQLDIERLSNHAVDNGSPLSICRSRSISRCDPFLDLLQRLSAVARQIYCVARTLHEFEEASY